MSAMKNKINLCNQKNSLALTWKFNHKYLLRIWENAVAAKRFETIKDTCDSIFLYTPDQLNEVFLDFKNDISFTHQR